MFAPPAPLTAFTVAGIVADSAIGNIDADCSVGGVGLHPAAHIVGYGDAIECGRHAAGHSRLDQNARCIVADGAVYDKELGRGRGLKQNTTRTILEHETVLDVEGRPSGEGYAGGDKTPNLEALDVHQGARPIDGEGAAPAVVLEQSMVMLDVIVAPP